MELLVRRIVIGCDHAAFAFKTDLAAHLVSLGVDIVDVGCYSTDPCDYPGIASALSAKIQSGEVQMGLLVCGSGIGVSIAANKCKGIRAALCHDYYTAQMCREHNDANVLCMGARVTGIEVAKQMLECFLKTPKNTENPNHAKRVAQINELDA